MHHIITQPRVTDESRIDACNDDKRSSICVPDTVMCCCTFCYQACLSPSFMLYHQTRLNTFLSHKVLSYSRKSSSLKMWRFLGHRPMVLDKVIVIFGGRLITTNLLVTTSQLSPTDLCIIGTPQSADVVRIATSSHLCL